MEIVRSTKLRARSVDIQGNKCDNAVCDLTQTGNWRMYSVERFYTERVVLAGELLHLRRRRGVYPMFHTWNNFKQNNADPGYYELEAKDGDSVTTGNSARAASLFFDEHQHPRKRPCVRRHVRGRRLVTRSRFDDGELGLVQPTTIYVFDNAEHARALGAAVEVPPAGGSFESEVSAAIEVELADHGAAERGAESLEVAALEVVLDPSRTARPTFIVMDAYATPDEGPSRRRERAVAAVGYMVGGAGAAGMRKASAVGWYGAAPLVAQRARDRGDAAPRAQRAQRARS